MNDSSEQNFLFVGLGNPGKKYERTRHNIGFLVVERFAQKLGVSFTKETKFNAECAKGGKVHLIKPHSYMNLSGPVVRRYMEYYKIPLQRVCVVVDDVALNFSQLRLRRGGASGGHNGLKSMQDALGSANYMRFRVGVGAPKHPQMPLEDFVLADFSRQELEELEPVIERSCALLELLPVSDIESVMNQMNRRASLEDKENVDESK